MVRLVLLLLVLPVTSFAQLWEFSEPETLKSGINTDYEETLPILTPDGTTLFFSRILYPHNDGGKFSGSDIWTSTFETDNDEWSPAVAMQRFNDRGNSSVVGVGGDGKTIYLMKTTG